MTTAPGRTRRPHRLDRLSVHVAGIALLLIPALAGCGPTRQDAAPASHVVATHSASPTSAAATPAPTKSAPTKAAPTNAYTGQQHRSSSSAAATPSVTKPVKSAADDKTTSGKSVPQAPTGVPSGYRQKAQKLKQALTAPGAAKDPAKIAAGARRLCAALDAGQLTTTEAAGALVMAGASIEEAVALVRTATATTCPQHQMVG